MALSNKYLDIYEDIFQQVWEMTLGQGQEGKEAYKGVRYFSKFLLCQAEKYTDAVKLYKPRIENRGIVAPKSVLNRHAAEMLVTCHQYRLVPPFELFEVISILLDCKPDPAEKSQNSNFSKFIDLRNAHPEMSTRAMSRTLGVDNKTARRYQDKISDSKSHDEYMEDYRRIRSELNIEEFFPMKYRR